MKASTSERLVEGCTSTKPTGVLSAVCVASGCSFKYMWSDAGGGDRESDTKQGLLFKKVKYWNTRITAQMRTKKQMTSNQSRTNKLTQVERRAESRTEIGRKQTGYEYENIGDAC